MKQGEIGEKQEFTKEVLEIEKALKGSDKNYSHYVVFNDRAILTIIKQAEPKCQNKHTSEVDLHIYLCEPGRFKEIDRGRLSISKRAKFNAEVKETDGVIRVNISASHRNKSKKYSVKYYH